jgi:hypothetical protein
MLVEGSKFVRATDEERVRSEARRFDEISRFMIFFFDGRVWFYAHS